MHKKSYCGHMTIYKGVDIIAGGGKLTASKKINRRQFEKWTCSHNMKMHRCCSEAKGYKKRCRRKG